MALQFQEGFWVYSRGGCFGSFGTLNKIIGDFPVEFRQHQQKVSKRFGVIPTVSNKNPSNVRESCKLETNY